MISLQGKSNYVFPVLPWKYSSADKKVLKAIKSVFLNMLQKFIENTSLSKTNHFRLDKGI